MKSGLYAFAGLDGAPLGALDEAILFAGLPAGPAPAQTFRAAAHDPRADAIDQCGLDGDLDLLLGHLDEPDQDMKSLGLPSGSGAAVIAAAAHDRWGVDAATRLGGEWTLLRWDSLSRTLTLLMSECARDSCYYAVAGGRVVVAAELARLARLPWVDDSFDLDGLARTMGQYSMRQSLGQRSILKGVNQLQPGTSVTIRAEGITTATAAPAAPPTLVNITFEDAMQEVEALLRRIVRARMAGAPNVAFLLSGGLDSSLLAWLGAEECGPGQQLHFLSSAAPEGSGLTDETGWAALVADHLGVPLTRVAPTTASDVYAPAASTFENWQSPQASPRHYLYREFEVAAADRSASVLMDGAFGEMSVTNHGFFLDPPASLPRRLARSARDGLASALRGPEERVAGHFHVRLSRSALTGMTSVGSVPTQPPRRLRPHEALGFETGWEKTAAGPTTTGEDGVRLAYPLRDRRLLRLVGSFPAAFTQHDGAPRAMVRAILRGRLPEAVASRQCKMPFSPTYESLLGQQASAARERIPSQRATGAGEWLDLDWLDRALTQVASQPSLAHSQPFSVQGTAMAAEFFRWWSERSAVRS